MIIDAHQHFWDPMRGDYGWLTPDLPIHRVYGADDLQPLMRRAGVDGTILVQAAATVAETDYMLAIARRNPFVLGVVGWIDLEAVDAPQQVHARCKDEHFLGVRPMLQDIPQADWILRPELTPALAAIAREALVLDALVLSHQIGVVGTLAQRHPDLAIVLDHAGKPRLGNGEAMAAWRRDIAPLAARPNVSCKISGLLTELPPGAGTEHVTSAIHVLLDLFGPQRLLWGSDWPVLTLAGNYQDWFAMARDAITAQAPDALDAIFGGNAARIYRPSACMRC